MKPANHNARSQQRGVALVVILMMLLVMTLLGLASLRGTMMEERMSAGSYDRSLSFQAAETALREAEATFAAGPPCGGTCPPPVPGGPDIWVTDPECDNTPTAGVWTPISAAIYAQMGRAVRPVYAIERVGPAPPPNNPGCGLDGDNSCMVDYFRITACSGDPVAGRAMTILQTNYTP